MAGDGKTSKSQGLRTSSASPKGEIHLNRGQIPGMTCKDGTPSPLGAVSSPRHHPLPTSTPSSSRPLDLVGRMESHPSPCNLLQPVVRPRWTARAVFERPRGHFHTLPKGDVHVRDTVASSVALGAWRSLELLHHLSAAVLRGPWWRTAMPSRRNRLPRCVGRDRRTVPPRELWALSWDCLLRNSSQACGHCQ